VYFYEIKNILSCYFSSFEVFNDWTVALTSKTAVYIRWAKKRTPKEFEIN
jgi:hypothetical protein